MNIQARKLLLEMLRTALGLQLCTDVTNLSQSSWNDVLHVVQKQGLSALLMDAINKDENLANSIKSMRDGSSQILHIIGTATVFEKRYAQYEHAVFQLAKFASDNSFPMLVLKGYGLSLNYPIPSHRLCGDIDIFTFGRHEELDNAIYEKLGIVVNNKDTHHSKFIYDGFLVENHKAICDPDSYREHTKRNQLLSKLAKEDIREINGLLFPSLRFNSIHLLFHMAGDFASTGTNLRRLLDWSTFVYRHKSEIDWPFVFDVANEFGILSFLNAVNMICSKFVGYPADLFPVRLKDEKPNFDKIVNRMFRDLLTGESKPLEPYETNIFKYGLVKGIRYFHNRWKYEMVYQESFWKSLWRLTIMRLRKWQN